MTKISAINRVVAAITITTACALPVMAQNTNAPSDTTPTTQAVNATTTERVDDNDRDYGWIGLLGLAGLLGLRKKPEDTVRLT